MYSLCYKFDKALQNDTFQSIMKLRVLPFLAIDLFDQLSFCVTSHITMRVLMSLKKIISIFQSC